MLDIPRSLPIKSLLGKKKVPNLTVYIQCCAFFRPISQVNYNAIRPEFYRLLPFLCQFTGQESKHLEVGQACLKALCYLSVCIVPLSTIDAVLDTLWKVRASQSKKAKISMLEFTQVRGCFFVAFTFKHSLSKSN